MLEKISIFTKKKDESTVTLCVVEAYLIPDAFIMNTYSLTAKEIKRNVGDIYVVRDKSKTLFPLDSDYDVGEVISRGSIKIWNYYPSLGVAGAYVRWVGTDCGVDVGATFIKDTLKRMLAGNHGKVANERKLLRDRLAMECELLRGEGPIEAPHIQKSGG